VQSAALSRRETSTDQPLRLLLIRSKPGELPWMAQTITKVMAPVQMVQVVGLANALWRLGNERFDSVLLDIEVSDRAAIQYCRDQIANVAAVPVLDLHDRADVAKTGAAPRDAGERQFGPRAAAKGRGQAPRKSTMRLPWERRPRREGAAPPKVATVG
jgi:hypothetical protein